ncbi:MAG: hypothetical protein ACQER7_13915 [Bacteroidota bacterium]
MNAFRFKAAIIFIFISLGSEGCFAQLYQTGSGEEKSGKSFEEVKKLIESARSKGQWLILVGHEMDEGGAQTSLLSTIEAICKYAADPANHIWIAPVHQIAAYIKDERDGP